MKRIKWHLPFIAHHRFYNQTSNLHIIFKHGILRFIGIAIQHTKWSRRATLRVNLRTAQQIIFVVR